MRFVRKPVSDANFTVGIGYQENNNQNSIAVTAYSSRSPAWSGDVSWQARRWVSLDTSYSKLHLDTIGGIAFFSGAPGPNAGHRIQFHLYQQHPCVEHRPSLLPRKASRFVRGICADERHGDGRSTTTSDAFYNAQAFPLTFQTPNARLSCGCRRTAVQSGLHVLRYKEKFGQLFVNENYRANTGYTSLLWSF